MSESFTKNVIEAALLAAGRPLTIAEISELFDELGRPDTAAIREALAALEQDYTGRGIEVKETGSGFRIQVRRDLANEISRLWPERPPRYSRALLETLALIAYRQPITRAEIEAVRGVAVNPNIIKTVIERNWVRVVGNRDVPGRPELLGTTKDFLDYFGLRSLDELPPLVELKAMGDVNLQLDLAKDPNVSDAGARAAVSADADAAKEASEGADAASSDVGDAVAAVADGEPVGEDEAATAAADKVEHAELADSAGPAESGDLAADDAGDVEFVKIAAADEAELAETAAAEPDGGESGASGEGDGESIEPAAGEDKPARAGRGKRVRTARTHAVADQPVATEGDEPADHGALVQGEHAESRQAEHDGDTQVVRNAAAQGERAEDTRAERSSQQERGPKAREAEAFLAEIEEDADASGMDDDASDDDELSAADRDDSGELVAAPPRYED